MDTVAIYFSSSDNDENEDPNTSRIQYRILRDRSNIFDLPEKRFISLFRLSKEAFKYILNETKDEFAINSRSSSIPPILKLAAAIRFFAQGSYQQGVGQEYLISMSQSKISVVINDVLSIIERKICLKWISYRQTDQQQEECNNFFYDKHGFPSVIGCIDGTHIKIIRPSTNEHIFFNRKGYHSINAMIVCDHNMRIIAIDPRYGGSFHDSSIWSLSSYNTFLKEKKNNNRNFNFWLLGDSGYPLQMWLITPFRSAGEGTREATFNTKHAKARNIIERCIGVLKQRFRCLLNARGLHYKPSTAAKIINVCASLHNICLHFKVPISREDTPDNNANVDIIASNSNILENENAIRLRNNIMNEIC